MLCGLWSYPTNINTVFLTLPFRGSLTSESQGTAYSTSGSCCFPFHHVLSWILAEQRRMNLRWEYEERGTGGPLNVPEGMQRVREPDPAVRSLST